MANQDIKFSPFQPQNYELPHLYPYRMETSIISCGQDFLFYLCFISYCQLLLLLHYNLQHI